MATANQKAKANEPKASNATGGNTFILDDDELAVLRGRQGRKASPSVYLDQVSAALKTGDTMGVQLTDTLSASWVGAQLRKAAKQLEIDSKRIKVYNREDVRTAAHPHGFVAFKVMRPGELSTD